MDAVYSSKANAAAKMMKRSSKWWGESRFLSEKESSRETDEGKVDTCMKDTE
jgi:hypothetical protein